MTCYVCHRDVTTHLSVTDKVTKALLCFSCAYERMDGDAKERDVVFLRSLRLRMP